MKFPSKNPRIILQFLIPCFLLMMSLQSTNSIITDNHRLIYNQCSNQTSYNPSHLSLISRLHQQFITQSSKSRFFETIVGDADATAISGLFQCRDNLTPDECKACVSKFQALSEDLCGENLPARIQLSGCYARYQDAEGPEDISRPENILHQACSKHRVKEPGFEEMKSEAFLALENGIMSGDGFCEMKYGSIHVVAQCSRNLWACDCGECVSNAVQIDAESGCRHSVSGEIYLERCYISYEYYGDRGYGGYAFGENGAGNSSSKLVAIVVGGIAAALLGLALCYFMRSCGKKKDDW